MLSEQEIEEFFTYHDYDPMINRILSFNYRPTDIKFIRTNVINDCNLYAVGDRIYFDDDIPYDKMSLDKYRLDFYAEDHDPNFIVELYTSVNLHWKWIPVISYEEEETLSTELYNYSHASGVIIQPLYKYKKNKHNRPFIYHESSEPSPV